MRVPLILVFLSIAAGVTTGLMPPIGFPNWFDTERSKYWFYRAQQCEKLDKKLEAISNYDEAIRLNPNYSRAFLNRGYVYLSLGFCNSAARDISRSFILDPENHKNCRLAAEAVPIPLDVSDLPYHSESSCVRAALTHLRNKNFIAALGECDKGISANPGNPLTYRLRGDAKGALGDEKGAIADYTKALALFPPDDFSLVARGLIYFDLKNYRSALKDFNESLKLDSSNVRLHVLKAMSLEHLGDLKGALKAYKVAIHVDPRYPDTYRSRGWTYSSIRNRTRAIQDFTKFIRLRPNDADGRAEYAMQIILVGRKQEALQQLNVAVKLDKNCVSAYIPRGSIRSEIGDMKGAISDLNKAIELRPDFSLGYYHRALALLKLGKKKSAQRDLKKALHLAPKDERVSQKLKDL